MLSEELASFLNCISPYCDVQKNIKAGDVDSLIQDALSIQFKRTYEESICIDKVYAFNNGFADFACHICFEEKAYYYYFKETGNNRGYTMGRNVYQINETLYTQYKAGSFVRDMPMVHILKLPAGDWDWLKDELLLKKLVYISNTKSIK